MPRARSDDALNDDVACMVAALPTNKDGLISRADFAATVEQQ